MKYEAPINITKNTTLKAIVKTENGEFSEVNTFDYTITDSLQIHDIQGEGHTLHSTIKQLKELKELLPIHSHLMVQHTIIFKRRMQQQMTMQIHPKEFYFTVD